MTTKNASVTESFATAGNAVDGIFEQADSMLGIDSVKQIYAAVRGFCTSLPIVGGYIAVAVSLCEAPAAYAFLFWLGYTLMNFAVDMPAMTVVGLTLGTSYLSNLVAAAAIHFAVQICNGKNPLSKNK